MEKKSPTGLPLKKRLVGTGDTSHVSQPRDISQSPPQTEEEKKDHSAGEAQSWDVQWREFLERVKSEQRLEEAAIWREARVLLDSFQAETKLSRSPKKEWAKSPGREEALVVLPPELQSWLRERGPETCAQAVALAEAFSWRQRKSRKREKQVAPETPSSAVQKDSSDLRQEEDGKPSLLAGQVPDCEKEMDQPGILLERDKEDTLRALESKMEEEGNATQKIMDKSIPCQGEAFQEKEKQREESGNTCPDTGTQGTKEKQNMCLQCGKSFRHKQSLIRHQHIHTGQKPYECTDCGKSFTRMAALTEHQRIHTKEKPYKCSECEKSFGYKRALRQHQRIHTGQKPYECTDCGKSFRQKATLTVHQRIHTKEKPYKCSECEKSFGRKQNLRLHQHIHTGVKPYKCTNCDKRFRQRGTLIAHQRIHARDKPYECSNCEKRFTYKINLQLHQRTHVGQGETMS